MTHKLGHQVIEASNGIEALSSISRRKPGSYVLVSDYSMPKMDGLKLVQTLAETGPKPAKAIIWTSTVDNDLNSSPAQLSDLGFPVKVISKPQPFVDEI